MAEFLSLANLIGLVAGMLVCISSIPQVVANLRNPKASRDQNVSRNILMIAGNALWVWYGIHAGTLPIVVFCGISVILNVCLTAQCLRART